MLHQLVDIVAVPKEMNSILQSRLIAKSLEHTALWAVAQDQEVCIVAHNLQ